ncbi:plasmid partitioning protein RepB [Agrobacterium leguminum]|jgi:ParB family chromosome partitioning protein|uniref:plasmid partitioning protein RepB n=1 Tax=Agrobacterium TaxID=357 RepID=UPI001573A31E|nr:MULTISPECIES: plasmid partitioning protein RepB [Agrobacterium]MCZ7935613.1 plasmid partitioning protein RepB [Agrobacterium leguminum]MCZ7977522.1 plasmid partitioning protein RepB [Agrobacterium salinitolerans]NTA35532.1 plasmid partitioning protein RepB [Agrobacterium salinitolerans]
MSRKNLLNLIQVDADMPVKAAASDNKLVGQVANTMREEKARQARADEIERRLAEGQVVIDLDTALVEPSFVRDRMPGDIDGLLSSIRAQGQQVPILVRPHPDKPGQYQVAFGHRRLRAVQELGLQVKAVIRALTDEELVIAQGQENNEREDLSYIEKSRFAQRLKERFPREVITSAMSIDKAELSRMLSVVEAIPADLIDAIGPAPGVGRRSWQELAELILKAESKNPVDLARSDELQRMTSQDRFKALLNALKPRRLVRGLPEVLSTSSGQRLGHIKHSKSKIEITLDRKEAGEFASFLLNDAVALFEERRAKSIGKKEA